MMKKKKERQIEVAYAIHDHFGSYYEYLGISMLSVMENTKETLRFHILCDGTLVEPARNVLRTLCFRYGYYIQFHEITLDKRISKTELLESGYNEGILYRLCLPELLPDVSKILYLDADILAHGDILELWNIELGDYAAAGRWDPPVEGFKKVEESIERKCQPFWESADWNSYVNSGVLVLNLDKIRREHRLLEESVSFWNAFGMAFPDQDALNYILRGKIKLLPPHLNMMCKDVSAVMDGYFYHYSFCGGKNDGIGAVDKLYLDYWEKSPFYKTEYGKKERVRFLKQLKSRLDVYLRLKELGRLDRNQALWLGECLYEKGLFEEAYSWLSDASIEKLYFPDGEKWSEKEKENQERCWQAEQCFYLALSLEALQRREEAISLIQRILSDSSRTGYLEHDVCETELWCLAGRLCYEESRYKEGISALEQCLYFGTAEKNMTAEYALRYLVKCAIRMENFVMARKYHTMLLTLAPLDERVRLSGIRITYGELKGIQDSR